MFEFLYIGSSNLITAEQIVDSDGVVVTAANSVTLSIYEPDGSLLSGGGLPLTLIEDQAIAGDYCGVLGYDANLRRNVVYSLEIVVIKNSERTTQRRLVKAVYKDFSK
jgi:hypothetical protein